MKKNILVIYTGGTICTKIKDGKMSTDETAASALTTLFDKSDSPYKDKVKFTDGKKFNILSENMTVKKWNEIIKYFLTILPDINLYSGIIIAHGTDTLAYTAALFSLLLKGIGIPVFFVSSNYPLFYENGELHPKANGCANFCAATECIAEGITPDVYATYQNPEDGKMYLHKAKSLIQCKIYDDNFYSCDAVDITDIGNVKSDVFRAELKSKSELLINRFQNDTLKNCVLKINPYVGLNYEMIALNSIKAVLHGTYHSGTVCSSSAISGADHTHDTDSVLYLFEKCAAKNIPFYLSPSQRSESRTVYESITDIENYTSNGQQIRFCYGDTDELIYAKLLISYSLDMSEEEIKEFICYS